MAERETRSNSSPERADSPKEVKAELEKISSTLLPRYRGIVSYAMEHFLLKKTDIERILERQTRSSVDTYRTSNPKIEVSVIQWKDVTTSLTPELCHHLLCFLYDLSSEILNLPTPTAVTDLFFLPVTDIQYKKVIPFPMDLSTIHARLIGGIYDTQEAFEVDIFELTNNFVWAYAPRHKYVDAALQLETKITEIAQRHEVEILRFRRSNRLAKNGDIYWKLQMLCWQEYLSMWSALDQIAPVFGKGRFLKTLPEIFPNYEEIKKFFQGIEDRLRVGSYQTFYTFQCDVESTFRACVLDSSWDSETREKIRQFVFDALCYHRSCRVNPMEIQSTEDDSSLSLDERRELISTLDTLQHSPDNKDGAFSYPPLLLGPRYIHVIKKPMDLYTIKCKVCADKYTKRSEVEDDLRLIAENAERYNGSNSIYALAARNLAYPVREPKNETGHDSSNLYPF